MLFKTCNDILMHDINKSHLLLILTIIISVFLKHKIHINDIHASIGSSGLSVAKLNLLFV